MRLSHRLAHIASSSCLAFAVLGSGQSAAATFVAAPVVVHVAPALRVAPNVHTAPNTARAGSGHAKTRVPPATPIMTQAKPPQCNSKSPVGTQCSQGTKVCTKSAGAFVDCPK